MISLKRCVLGYLQFYCFKVLSIKIGDSFVHLNEEISLGNVIFHWHLTTYLSAAQFKML